MLTNNSILNSSEDVIPLNHAISDKLVMGHGQANTIRLACIKIFLYIFEALKNIQWSWNRECFTAKGLVFQQT